MCQDFAHWHGNWKITIINISTNDTDTDTNDHDRIMNDIIISHRITALNYYLIVFNSFQQSIRFDHAIEWAPKLYFRYYSCVVISLFNTGLRMFAFSDSSVGKEDFCRSMFFLCFEFDVIFLDFIGSIKLLFIQANLFSLYKNIKTAL